MMQVFHTNFGEHTLHFQGISDVRRGCPVCVCRLHNSPEHKILRQTGMSQELFSPTQSRVQIELEFGLSDQSQEDSWQQTSDFIAINQS